jgi:hypothetical protein
MQNIIEDIAETKHTIKFTGTNTRYQVKKYCLENANESLPVCVYPDHAAQLKQLNIFYMDTSGKDLERLFQAKLSGYKAQDMKNKKLANVNDNLITLTEITEKLVASRLRCCYCGKAIFLFYAQRDALQWTLDRLDNDLGHTKDNTVIACLGCNLQRRTRSADKFMFTKKLTITKKASDTITD